jgi:pyrimidine operon attenuation protein/uracil phosphoribosyltransferase
MSIDKLGSTRVSTEIVMKGCTVRMTQMVETGIDTTAAHLAAQIDGETLTIQSADKLSGNVMVTQFDDKGQPACSGMYDAEFSQTVNSVGGAAMPTVGGAAQH